MPFIYPNHRGTAYGGGHMQGDGKLGQVVRITGDDLFAVNTDAGEKSFGFLINSYTNGEMPGIYCNGGIYETDAFEGKIKAGDDLKVSENGLLTSGAKDGDQVIGRAISVSGGTLKFRSLI